MTPGQIKQKIEDLEKTVTLLQNTVTLLQTSVINLQQQVNNISRNNMNNIPIWPGYYPPNWTPAPVTWPTFKPYEVTCQDGSTIKINSPIVAQGRWEPGATANEWKPIP